MPGFSLMVGAMVTFYIKKVLRFSTQPNSENNRSQHNACKFVTWRGGWQLLKEWMNEAAETWGKVAVNSCMLPRLTDTVEHGSAMTDVCGLCTTWHQIIALRFNTATSHKAEVTLHAGMKQGGRLSPESPPFSSLVSHPLTGSPECTHCWAGTQTRTTHTSHHREPWGLRCLEVNRIIRSCSVLTLR